MPSRRAALSLFTVPAVAALGGCSPLRLFNAVATAGENGTLAAEGLAYGPNSRQRLDIYAPRGVPARPLPVIVFTYGGSWSNGSRTDYAFVGRAFAEAGFVAVVYDYRLVPEVRFPAFVEDGAEAVRFVHETIGRYGGDGRRILLAGHSAGAYNTAMLALDRRFLRRAGVPPVVVRAAAGWAGPYDFLPLDVDETIAAFGDAEDPAATQPVNFVRPGAPPFFLAAGADDRVVQPRNTLTLGALLEKAGVPVEVKIYPDVGHAGLVLAAAPLLSGRAPVLADTADFFRTSLG